MVFEPDFSFDALGLKQKYYWYFNSWNDPQKKKGPYRYVKSAKSKKV